MYAWDGKDEKALERRMNVRPSHFNNARKLKASGDFITGGAMLNEEGKMIGSMMVVQSETKEQLQQWLDAEPYVKGKVWEKIDLWPFIIADV